MRELRKGISGDLNETGTHAKTETKSKTPKDHRIV
jgi:hypothetical protein